MFFLFPGATYVARGFPGDVAVLTNLIPQAVTHKGFSVLDVLQPCVTFNHVHTYQWYRQRLYALDTAAYQPDNRLRAIEKAMEWGDKIPVGVFYQEKAPTSEDREPALAAGALAQQPVGVSNENALLSEFR